MTRAWPPIRRVEPRAPDRLARHVTLAGVKPRPGAFGLNLTSADRRDLIAFLKTL
jgi:hypothetical protein